MNIGEVIYLNGSSINYLEQQVNAQIKRGFCLHGNIVFTSTADHVAGKIKNYYIQCMIKNKEVK